MENKRIKRVEQADRKCVNDKIKDRGDLKTVLIKNDYRMKKDNTVDKMYPGGDSRKVSSNQKPEKNIKLNLSTKPAINENKAKQILIDIAKTTHKFIPDAEKELLCKRPAYLKRVRDKYTTTKLKSQPPIMQTSPLKRDEAKINASNGSPIESVKNSSTGDHVRKLKIELVTPTKEKEKGSSNGSSECAKDRKEQDTQRKKPIIKTIMTKNDSMRVYKAVTFGERKQKLTPLQIKIPNDTIQNNNSKNTDVNSMKSKLTVSRISVHEKIEDLRKKKIRKRDRKFKHVPSRDGSYRENSSPPTEVAKWAPSSIDRHTRPYYEAWVNTTLSAISKSKNREKLLNDEKFMIQSFWKAFERPETPELIYSDFTDEKYTGRIKIKQR